MMKLTQKDFKILPWKNQGGTTIELFKAPNPKDSSKFLIRFSIATVDKAGPFSIFEGVDRHLILLTGNGMSLDFKSEQIILDKPFQKIQFRGEETIDCTLIEGQTKDFNVMIDRSWGSADVEVIHVKKNEILNIKKEKTVYIYNYQTNEFSILSDEVFNELATDNFDYIVTTTHF